MAELSRRRVAILATDMFEQVELVEPRKALDDAGAETEIVSLEKGEIQGFTTTTRPTRSRSTRRSTR